MYDLVSLGEVMLRLSPPKFERLRSARKLDVHVAGSQLNVAANLARLGKRTSFISKLPANELGILTRDVCMSYGVDTSWLHFVPEGRLGVNYVEFGATPRAGVTVYDRRGSAASTITPDDFDWESALSGTRLAFTDGIFPGLSPNCAATTLKFLATAKRLGCTTCFDVNFREHLWTEQTAAEVWRELLPHIDVLVTNRSVSETVFGYSGTDEEILAKYQEEFGCKITCLTTREIFGVLKGAWNSIALSDGKIVEGVKRQFDIVDRFGTGDAWFAGFLYGYLERDLEYALNFANTLCALAHTTEGDVIQFSVDEVADCLGNGHDLRLRR